MCGAGAEEGARRWVTRATHTFHKLPGEHLVAPRAHVALLLTRARHARQTGLRVVHDARIGRGERDPAGCTIEAPNVVVAIEDRLRIFTERDSIVTTRALAPVRLLIARQALRRLLADRGVGGRQRVRSAFERAVARHAEEAVRICGRSAVTYTGSGDEKRDGVDAGQHGRDGWVSKTERDAGAGAGAGAGKRRGRTTQKAQGANARHFLFIAESEAPSSTLLQPAQRSPNSS